MMKKTNVAGLALVIVFSFFAGRIWAEPLALVKNGEPLAVIVQEENEDWRFRLAVRRLREYVKEATGADIRVAAGDKTEGPAIHIGRTALVKGMNLPPEGFDREGVILKRVGDNLIIAGGSTVGTQHAVSLFLEKVCGVRWYLPGPDDLWRIVPDQPTLEIGELDFVHEPSYLNRSLSGTLTRGWSRSDADNIKEWLDLNRAYPWGNRLHIPHNIANIIPPSEYYDKHPEYFPLIGGERVRPRDDSTRDWHPCLSNPEVAELAIAAARKHFTESPDSEIFSVAQNDNWGWCQCENCIEMNSGAKYDEDGTQDWSNLFVLFANRVAEEVNKTHPGKLIGMMAYQYGGTFWPPTVPLHPNVVVLVVGDRSRFHFDQKFRGRVKGHLESWAEHAGRFTFHNWHFSGIIPIMELKSTQEFLRFGHSVGSIGYHGEEYPNWGSTGPKTWITARLVWDVNEDVDTLLQDFCDNSFGKASAPMRRFYDTLEEMWNTQPVSQAGFKVLFRGGNAHRQLTIFTPRTAGKCRALLDEAAKLAADDEQAARRIAHVDKTFRITEYLVHREAIYNEIDPGKHLTAQDFPKLVRNLEKMQEITGKAEVWRDEHIKGNPFTFRGGEVEFPSMDNYFSRLGSYLAAALARLETADAQPASQHELVGALLERFAALESSVDSESATWEAFRNRVKDYLGATAVVPRLARTTVIDGTPEKEGTAAIRGFRVFRGGRTLDEQAEFQTTVRLGYDDKALYISYTCHVPDLETLVATGRKRDSAVWRDDCVDFAILPHERSREEFFHFVINSQGVVYDEIGSDSEWDSEAEIAVGRDEKAGAWTVELAIPWSDFERTPVSGEVWKAQFARADVVEGSRQAYSCWAPTSAGFNNADYMGVLLFE